ATPVPVWSPGASRSRRSSAPRSATRTTGVGRSRGSARPTPVSPAAGPFAALCRAGRAGQPTSTHIGDGLELTDVRVAAAVRCAPPANAPTPEERDTCSPWLARQLEPLGPPRVVGG